MKLSSWYDADIARSDFYRAQRVASLIAAGAGIRIMIGNYGPKRLG